MINDIIILVYSLFRYESSLTAAGNYAKNHENPVIVINVLFTI